MKHATVRRCTGFCTASNPARVGNARFRSVYGGGFKSRLGQTSANSSQPPSSDGPHVKPAPPKTPSCKAKGGQPRHPRNERHRLTADPS